MQKKTIDSVINKKVFMSYEEIRDIEISTKNMHRPMRSAYCSNLLKLW